MANHVRQEAEYYLSFTLEGEQSLQGLIDHLSLGFQFCKTVSSLISDFYDVLEKLRETKDTFADELQILMHMNVACKLESMRGTKQALEHQYLHNLHDPLFGVVAWGQFLAFPESQSVPS